MNPEETFECAPLIKSLTKGIDSDAKSERIVLWPQQKVALDTPLGTDQLAYVEAAHDGSSILLDPDSIRDCGKQIETLKRNGYLENDLQQQVMMITVKLREDISSLNDDLSINREVVHSLEDFKQLRSVWGRFQVDPMNSFAWNLSWWNAFQTHGDLHMMKFERAGSIVGIAPFYIDRWFGLKRLRFLATGDACTDYADIVCDPLHYELCAWSLAEYIGQQKFDVVELECTRDDRLPKLLKRSLSRRYRFDHRIAEPTWRLELPETWDAFVGGTKKSLRRKINKASRRLDSGECVIESTSFGLCLETAYETFRELHTRRLNSTGKPGMFADPQFEQFIESVVYEFASEGRCEIVLAKHEGRPIAAQLYFVSNLGFQLYNSGYDPDAMQMEPGHLLFTAMTQRAIKRGDPCVDFLRGNEPYKEFWGAVQYSQKKLRMIIKKPIPILVSTIVASGRAAIRSSQTA